MPSILRQIQEEWNALVPTAQARGFRRVRVVPPTRLESIASRRAKLEWLRSQLSLEGSFANLSFGVEIEFFRPAGMHMQRVAELITAAGVPAQVSLYGHAVPTGHWKVITDGSLGYARGAEVVSPPLRGEAGFDQLQKVMTALTAMGGTVTKKCGFHVHVGVATEGIDFFKNLVGLYCSAERAIDSFMAPSRRGDSNRFIRTMLLNQDRLAAAQTVANVAAAVGQTANSHRDGTRYKKLNLKSYWAYSTVEFRHHQGTVDADKAANWVRLCLRMVLASRAGGKQVTTVDELMAAVEATDSEKQFFNSRAAYFGRARG